MQTLLLKRNYILVEIVSRLKTRLMVLKRRKSYVIKRGQAFCSCVKEKNERPDD